MILIPIQGRRGGESLRPMLILVLERENLARLARRDPFDFQPAVLAAVHPSFDLSKPIRDLEIVIAFEEDVEALGEFQKARDIDGLLAYLQRGRVHRQGDGGEPVEVRS